MGSGGGLHYPLGAAQSLAPGSIRLCLTSKVGLDPAILSRPISTLPGVGKTIRGRLEGLGIETIGDLLLHLPFRHEAPSRLVPVAELAVGEEVTLRVQVVSSALHETSRRRVKVLEALVSDDSGSVLALWYNQAYLEAPFRERPEILVRGTLIRQRGRPVFVVKRHEILGEKGESFHVLGLVPIYPSTADLSVRTIRTLLHRAEPYARHLLDPLPARLLTERRYARRPEAVMASHFPADGREALRARERLAFEELLLLQVAVLKRRKSEDGQRAAQSLTAPSSLVRAYLDSLPFELTGAQCRVMAEIDADLARQVPMRRLLHGDVGSGKTVVAAYCMLRAVERGGQAALMAPTEVLADQHFWGLSRQLAPLGVEVRLLKGSQSAKDRREVLDALREGEAGLVVGTHALIQQGVVFKDLRVAVVDEQHRFGVQQRDAILKADEGPNWPHVLHMSATPIPRTLSLTLYGDLDVSTLDELPPGRSPVSTRLVSPESEERMWDFVREQLRQGRQAYVVCPLIEESEVLQSASACETAEVLAGGELAGFEVRLLHGQLPAVQKAETMAAYAEGRVDVLVSTTVIEVGVDVANATVMVIMGARRFGLSQLHQLRGRVGRGAERSYCFLMAAQDEDEASLERLALFARTNDGFALAEADLAARGEGQLFGTRQSGLGDLKVASLLRDQRLLEDARKLASRLLERSDLPEEGPIWGPVFKAAEESFGSILDWVDRA